MNKETESPSSLGQPYTMNRLKIDQIRPLLIKQDEFAWPKKKGKYDSFSMYASVVLVNMRVC